MRSNGVRPQTSSLAVYGETARYPLFMRQQDQAVKLWLRLKLSKSNKPINQVFNELENLQSLGYKTWLTKIKDIVGNLYENISIVADPKCEIRKLKDMRYKKFTDAWLADINNRDTNPKLRTYSQYIFKRTVSISLQ